MLKVTEITVWWDDGIKTHTIFLDTIERLFFETNSTEALKDIRPGHQPLEFFAKRTDRRRG